MLLGVENGDDERDITWLVKKICGLRIFDDDKGVMNLSVNETGGEALVVSQFTLLASCKKGNRPSYARAARHETAASLYDKFCKALEHGMQKPVKTGFFGAHMKVCLLNDGPVTICIDTKNKE